MFNFNWSNEETFGLHETGLVKQCKTDDDVFDVQDCAEQYSRAVISMPLEYGIGTDIRFKEDAMVVVANEEMLDSELIKQLISRGVRSLGKQEGRVFAIGQPN